MIHIGVLSPVTGGFYFGEVLAGVVRAVAEVDGRVTLVQTLDAGRTGDDVAPAPDRILPVGWEHLDGFVVVAQAVDAAHVRGLRAAGKPVVMVSDELEAVDAATVAADNSEGIRSAVAHLAGHGHTRIAFVGNLSLTDTQERHDAYRQSMATLGLDPEGAVHIPTADHIETGGRAAAHAVATARPPITAVLAATDRIALGLMAGLADRGVRVPRDIAVIGFDGTEAGWRSTPPLATVDQHIAELGAQAASLLLAELRGDDVEHRRYTHPSTLLPRGSCGCSSPLATTTGVGVVEAEALVAAVVEHLASSAGAGDPHGVELTQVDLEALDAVIERSLETLHRTAPAPEALERFTETTVRLFGSLARDLTEAGLPGRETFERCISRTTILLSRLGTASGAHRSDRLSTLLIEQYDVGMSLFAQVDSAPADLAWLGDVSVPVGCLALWEGPPEARRLRIAGLHDPDDAVRGYIPATCRVEQFPPRALIDQADPHRNQVCFVIPVRGPSGDHGLLCLVGRVDTSSGSGRATYNHWAALLGVALKQQGLLEHLRQSEERYSLAAAATQDGLWDWDLESRTCFFSDRCHDLLVGHNGTEVAPDADWAPELHRWSRSVHPDDLADLRAGLRRAVVDGQPFEVEHRLRHADGGHRWVVCRGLPVGEPGRPARRVVGSLADIHPRKDLEEQLRQGALYDPLTGLPNRRLFLERLSRAVAAERSGGTDGSFAVAFLDLDGFKLINDSLGHLMGDELLKTMATRLEGDLRSVDTAARFGGDEFAVLLTGMRHEAVLSVVDRIQERIAAPVHLGTHQVCVSASVGIARSDTGYTAAEDVLRDADIAMYHAKDVERGTASVFEPEMHARATVLLHAHSELRTALLEEQFEVHYQPLVSLDGSGLSQFEALVRWRHPERGVRLPGDFLPVMVENGTVVALGQWIIGVVCAQIAEWRAGGHDAVQVSVNLSHREFWSDQLLVTVNQALLRHDVPPQCLVLEITESVIMADPVSARQIMADLHASGLRLHIDDFGTGHSSLHALRAFPVDALKIDQSFVQQLGIDAQTTELVRIIVAMGRTLGIDVVAEGVETPAQATALRAMGCATVQGWLYSQALPGGEAAELLGRRLGAEGDDAAGSAGGDSDEVPRGVSVAEEILVLAEDLAQLGGRPD